MNKTLLQLGTAAALLAAPCAYAQGYVGLAVGPAKINIDCTGADTCDRTDTGFKLYGGMRFPSQLAVEGVYFDWGRAVASATDVELGTGELKVRASGVGAGVAYFLPFATQWTGAVRVGVVRNRAKTTASIGGLSGSETFSGWYPYYGFGIGYNVTPNLVITGEADFSRLEYATDTRANVQLLSVGVRYAF